MGTTPAGSSRVYNPHGPGAWRMGGNNFTSYARVRLGTVQSGHGQCAMSLVDQTISQVKDQSMLLHAKVLVGEPFCSLSKAG